MFLKTAFLRIIATLVCAVMLIPALGNAGEEYDVKDPAACKMNFSILSDSHIEGNNYPRYKIFARALQNVKKNKSGNDAIVFLGDNTMNCQNIENIFFHGTVSLLLGGENILSVLGNHDIGNGEGDYEKLQNRWFTYTEAFFGRHLEKPYYYEIVDGYYFIVLGTEAHKVYDLVISDEQYEWLEGVLEKAAESGKPVFVFSHFPMSDETDTEGNLTDRLTQLFAEYNRENDIFCFVGHTHMPMYLFWSFHSDDGFPEIYLPRLTELYGENDREPGKNSGVGAEVEIYENEVCVRSRNFYTGEWRYEEDEGAFCEMTYELKNPVQ